MKFVCGHSVKLYFLRLTALNPTDHMNTGCCKAFILLIMLQCRFVKFIAKLVMKRN